MKHQTLLYIKNFEEYENTGFLSKIDISFSYDVTMGVSTRIHLPLDKTNINKVNERLKYIFKKMSFVLSDGIEFIPHIQINSTGFILNELHETIEQFDVNITFLFKYEKHPNYYKLKEDGLIPCCPRYDKHMLEYLFCHSFEPTLNMVKLDYGHINLEQ